MPQEELDPGLPETPTDAATEPTPPAAPSPPPPLPKPKSSLAEYLGVDG